uniref:Uncharacterized protein n=1 Tax=Anas zonorhyncha TaxID=75864 RepID=A0A8B9UDX6_9AVES
MASVAQGGYLNPMAAFAAAQMQQMAAVNMKGLAAAPITPTSGKGPRGVERVHPSITSPSVSGIPPQIPTAADPLQQAYARVQQYAGR